MKKVLILCLLAFLPGIKAFSQDNWSGRTNYDLTVTKITVLGKSAADGIAGNKKFSNGKVNDRININTKNNTIKIADNKISFKNEDIVVENFPQSYLIKGKGIVVGYGKEAKFQIILNKEDGQSNVLVTWPDYSAARILAELKEK